MTENKRYSFNWERGHPNFWDNHCDLADCYLTCEDVVDRLNDLHDENKKLKMFLKAVNEELSLANRDCDILEEENEQLKKELKRCRDWLNSDKNDYQLTLAFIKSKGYSLKDVLEYEKELEE